MNYETGAGTVEVALNERAGMNKSRVIKEHVVSSCIARVTDCDGDGIGPGRRRGRYHNNKRRQGDCEALGVEKLGHSGDSYRLRFLNHWKESTNFPALPNPVAKGSRKGAKTQRKQVLISKAILTFASLRLCGKVLSVYLIFNGMNLRKRPMMRRAGGRTKR